jgi:hypothetical protein
VAIGQHDLGHIGLRIRATAGAWPAASITTPSVGAKL